ncbi:MAG: hypothetical protein J0I08_19390 [Rhizobiales bacterium]|nr:hypothetical protein [Hyphomicrobiales bacterium]
MSDTGPDWRKHRYKELFYRSGPKKILQVETLCGTAVGRSKATYPAYIFYNLQKTCNSAHVAGAKNLLGVNLTDATVVRALAAASPSKWYERKHSAVSALYPFMFSLADLLCPSNIQPLGMMAFAGSKFSIPAMISFGDKGPMLGRPIPPRPDQIRSRLVEQRNKLKSLLKGFDVAIDLPEIPEVSREIPQDLLPLIDPGYAQGIASSSISYWRATFISMNPTDQLGRPTTDHK